MKKKIHWWLTLLRDRALPGFIVNGIDWLRYEVFYTYEE